jgi:hypothetical protein
MLGATDTNKLMQQVGNLAIEYIKRKYPEAELRFFVVRGGHSTRIFIADKRDGGGRTGRLFDLGDIPRPEPFIVNEVVKELARRIEMHVQQFLTTGQ